ncbi:hypothetical protein CP533_0059 [Ophiocordyceps camponoti-saundersi (nom. inval.)]|nr:hypothetical protein CP533_0059 [Ophiocordyceps camponoti-saundersi (nom. inval.)]
MGRKVKRTLATIVALAATRVLAGAKVASAEGLSHRLVLDGLSKPRGLVEDSRGNLLVVERGKGVLRVVLDGSGVGVAGMGMAVDEDTLNHGIDLSTDGRILFASSSTDVYAWDYDANDGKAWNRRHLITGMKQGGHETRTLLVPRHDKNLLLVSRGSDGNVDMGTRDVGSGRSQIRVFRIDELLRRRGPVGFDRGDVLGWGLRNSVGVAEDPTTGNIWSVENSLDNMHRQGQDIHQTNPGDELNFHGRPSNNNNRQSHGRSSSSREEQPEEGYYGRNFGYPGCVAIWDPSVVKMPVGGRTAVTGLQMTGDHVAGLNYTDEWCRAETVAPMLTLDAHLAPLDIEFHDDGSEAYVSMHGSWNRKPGVGYRLSRFAFGQDGFPLHDRSSRTAEKPMLWDVGGHCPDLFGAGRCFRPVGVALASGGGGGGGGDGGGPRQRLFVTSDDTGELFVVTGELGGAAAGSVRGARGGGGGGGR